MWQSKNLPSLSRFSKVKVEVKKEISDDPVIISSVSPKRRNFNNNDDIETFPKDNKKRKVEIKAENIMMHMEKYLLDKAIEEELTEAEAEDDDEQNIDDVKPI